MKKNLTVILFLLPGGCLLALFVVCPLLAALRLSFFNYDVFSPERFSGLSNYAAMYSNPNFWNAAQNSMLYLVVTPALACASLAAAVLVDRKLPGINLFRAAYFIPVVIPMVIAGITWKFILSDDVGVLNRVLLGLQVIREPVYWLTGTDLAIFSVMFVTFWKGIGYYMVLFLAGLQAVPQSLYEAARLDGASSGYAFRRITLPLIKPTLTLVLILSATTAIRVFDEVYVLTGGGPLRSSETLIFYMYANALNEFPPRIGFACAVGVVVAAAAAGIAAVRRMLVKEP